MPFLRQAGNGYLGLVLENGPHRKAVVAVVVVHVGVARIEVEVPRVVRVVRVERTRPVVAVRASVVELTVPTVARSGQEETPSKECVSGLLFSGPKECLSASQLPHRCYPTLERWADRL